MILSILVRYVIGDYYILQDFGGWEDASYLLWRTLMSCIPIVLP